MKATRKTKLLKSTLNKKLEDFRKFRISNIPQEEMTANQEKEEKVLTANTEKTKSKGFLSKLLKK